jgi:hypothetical protein
MIGRLDDAVIQALMVPFPVIMGEELKDRPTQRVFAEEDEPRNAFVLEAAHKTLDVWRQVRRTRRQA